MSRQATIQIRKPEPPARADGAGRGPAESLANGEAPEERTQRMGGVERRMVERGGERLCVSRDVHQPRLQDSPERDAGADRKNVNRERRDCRRQRNASSATNANTRMTPAVGISARSAKRGTNRLPSVAPMPKIARKNGMTSALTLVTSIKVVAR